MSAYGAGQLFGLLILAVIVIAIVRGVMRRRGGDEES
jgi:hypothetical protein